MATRKTSPPSPPNWYDSPVKKTFAVLTGFLFVAGTGYGFALVQKDIEWRMDKNEWRQQCNERLQEQSDRCREAQQALENKRVEALETLVKQLQSSYHVQK